MWRGARQNRDLCFCRTEKKKKKSFSLLEAADHRQFARSKKLEVTESAVHERRRPWPGKAAPPSAAQSLAFGLAVSMDFGPAIPAQAIWALSPRAKPLRSDKSSSRRPMRRTRAAILKGLLFLSALSLNTCRSGPKGLKTLEEAVRPAGP